MGEHVLIMNILNLTRTILPKLSQVKSVNIANLNNMPENILRSLIRQGRKDILYVDMNRCGAAVIKKDGIQTVFTDALAGCNSVGSVIPLSTKENLCILSHYVPTNTAGQVEALEKQLRTYEPWINKDKNVQLFFNIRESVNQSENITGQNPIIGKVVGLFEKIFNKKPEVHITPYQNNNRPPFFSTANIFQFDTENKLLKITNVGEKEQFISLG